MELGSCMVRAGAEPPRRDRTNSTLGGFLLPRTVSRLSNAPKRPVDTGLIGTFAAPAK